MCAIKLQLIAVRYEQLGQDKGPVVCWERRWVREDEAGTATEAAAELRCLDRVGSSCSLLGGDGSLLNSLLEYSLESSLEEVLASSYSSSSRCHQDTKLLLLFLLLVI
jgi:hypothetical protein